MFDKSVNFFVGGWCADGRKARLVRCVFELERIKGFGAKPLGFRHLGKTIMEQNGIYGVDTQIR